MIVCVCVSRDEVQEERSRSTGKSGQLCRDGNGTSSTSQTLTLLFCVLPLLCVSLQILQAGSHHASYVLVRGSVPVFWTQPGTKYRPPPIIERGYLLTHYNMC